MRKMRNFLALILPLSLGAIFGCAERLGDIDKTHPHVVDKSIFDGEWYYRDMLTDLTPLASYGVYGFIGTTSNLQRIRWEITEDFLLGYATEEFFPGRGDVGTGRNLQEQLVAKYAVQSHSDIRRRYNEQTGEESNVIYEDTTSRKWFERQQMHIDWSNNQAGSWMKVLLPTQGEYAVEMSDTTNSEPYLLDISKKHINITSRKIVGLESYGETFASSMATVLTSLVRIDPDNDYIPLDFPAQVKKRDEQGNVVNDADGEPEHVDMFSRYGFFQTERQEYDRYDGEVWKTRKYLIQRFNIWKKSKDAKGNPIPMLQRQLKPIIYFVAEDYPREMLPAATKIGTLWNQGFKKSLTDIGYPVDNNTVVFAVCDNPVTSDSPQHCQDTGLGMKLFGDLRHNFLKLARPKGTVNPLGYGPASTDPRSGETINAWSVTYYAGLNEYAKYALDMVKMFNKEIDPNDYDWVDGDFYKGMNQSMSQLLKPSATSKPATGLMSDVQLRQADNVFRDNPAMLAEMQLAQQQMHQSLNGQSILEAFNQQLKSKQAHGMGGKSPIHQVDRRDLMGFMSTAPKNAHQAEEMMDKMQDNPAHFIANSLLDNDKRLKHFAEHNIYVTEFADPAIAYLAQRVAKKYPYPAADTPNRAELVKQNDAKILKALRDSIYIAVMLHEVGHNLGLRHNFAASTDEHNYVQPGVTSFEVDNDVFVGHGHENNKEGYWDVVTRPGEPMQNRLEYQYSSVMDYGASFASDLHGLGDYDIAAVRFGYLNHVEVWGQEPPDLTGLIARYQASQNGTNDAQELELIRKKAEFEALKHRKYVAFDANKVSQKDYFEGTDIEGYFVYESIRGADGQDYYLNRHKFCTDTFADFFDLFCSRWDVGAGPYEISQLYADRMESAYWFHNFARGRVDAARGFNGGLINRVFQRYLFYAMRTGLLGSYFKLIYADAGEDVADLLKPEFDEEGNQLQGTSAQAFLSLAANNLNHVMNTLMAPGTGNFVWNAPDNEMSLHLGAASTDYVWEDGVQPDVGPRAPMLERGYSRSGPRTQIDNQPWAHPPYSKYVTTKEEWVSPGRYGYYNNKIGALLGLFVGFGADLDQFTASEINSRFMSLSLANAFRGETVEYLTSLLMEDEPNRYMHLPQVGQNADGTPVLMTEPGNANLTVKLSNRVALDLDKIMNKDRQPSAEEQTLANLFGGAQKHFDAIPRVQSSQTDYEFQYGFYLAHAYLGSMFDNSWQDFLRINKRGDLFSKDYAEAQRVVEWADEDTGNVWVAYQHRPIQRIDGEYVDPSVGARYLSYIKKKLATMEGEENRRARQAFLTQVRYKLDFMYNLQAL